MADQQVMFDFDATFDYDQLLTKEELAAREISEAEDWRRIEEVESLKALLKTYHGRFFVWRLLAHIQPNHLSFHPDSERLTCVREGRRSVGNWVLSEVFTADANSYNVMCEEARERKTRKQRTEEHARS